MSVVVPNVFKGIAMVIDNDIGREPDGIDKIIKSIRDSGGHFIKMDRLPDIAYDLDHLSGVSFFIMDWNLEGDTESENLELGITKPAGLKDAMVAENIAFLKRLSRSRHAPVFVFTNETPEDVQELLMEDEDLRPDVQARAITVQSKTVVGDRLYEVLENWANETPSVLTLKSWERSHRKAANELFVDLHNRTTYWPVMMWQTFQADGVFPKLEMARLLNRLVESRMGELDLDLDPFVGTVEEKKSADEDDYRRSMFRVLEGERFVRNARLDAGFYATGDVFSFRVPDSNQVTYWINVRAECDCLRGGDSHELYLLRTKEIVDADNLIDPDYGAILKEKDSEAIVYAMFDGRTFAAQFRDLKPVKFKTLRKDYVRVGRLLPPFVTRLQQRYAAYIQRPGLPRIPPALKRTGGAGG
ncbi:hypothetical protein [Aurantimonas sp. 22II-16-19i]|uniref:hypothetical protein n=1 Tax=Aurantimonas sp. 22II-16-19i TaxID=1317114 RepID=UPI0009F7A5FF|nr:hypothetical protein [Aurantimonas sp. 22II-16-19i]ORE89771.1 hypothetical protein ATO4_23872 [Aurantimonas sp. 22II-16-19i]